MTKQIAIIGAGIGGLTTAITLNQAGFNVTVYESAPEIKPVGAGIVMANNAMQVYKKLGIQEKIEKAGWKISTLRITNAKLETILKVDLKDFENEYGVYNVAIHRADLQRVLAETVGHSQIILSKRLKNIEKSNSYKLTFDDGTSAHCDILIGADGIHSTVRKKCFENTIIRDSKQRCWRGVLALSPDIKIDTETFEAWGKGKRFGASKINDTHIYWFAVINESLIKNKPIAKLFEEFHPDILNIITKTNEENIIFGDILDLKPIPHWQNKNVCLIGDAAHATTPNMGQGACQAVEDAYVLATLLQQGYTFEESFERYEKMRIKKARNVVKTSWMLGKIGHIENPIGISIRNFMFKSLPQSLQKNQMRKIFDINYF